MNNEEKKLIEIEQFIEDYIQWTQERGHMYGSVSELEAQWELLNHIYFILNDLHREYHKFNFSVFLSEKGYNAKHDLKEYSELNKLWNDYIKWRVKKIQKAR